MSRWQLVVALVVLVGGSSALAYQQAQIRKLETELKNYEPATSTEPSGNISVEDARLALLEERVTRLTKIALDNRRMTQSSEGVTLTSDVSEEEIASIREEIDALALLDSEETRERFREVIREEQDRARDERREEARERWEREADQRLDDFITQNGLDEDQSEALRQTMTSEREQAMALREKAQAGELAYYQAREQWMQIRETTDDAVGEFLDDEQYGAYLELRDEWGGGGGGGRRGR